MNTQVVSKQKSKQQLFKRQIVTADANGDLPTRIEVMRAGTWIDSVKGTLVITTADLQEMKSNFDAGLSQAGDGIGLPIDFSHESWDKAAGWIKGLQVEGDILYADPVEWSDSGKAALLGGEYKCFSPTFWPACLGEWTDPEDYNVTARNVLEGGALTNIPFFKDLTPIMASTSDKESGDKNVIFISASEKENKSMTLEEVRAKAADALTEEEKTFLVDNKDQLTAEDRTKFGFEVTSIKAEEEEEQEEEEEAPTATVDSELAAVAASIKSGEKVLVEASTLKSLQQVETDYRTEKAEAIVASHIERGAVKADSKETWVKKLLTDKTGTEELLKSIPDNKLMADEIGRTNANDDLNESDRIVTLAKQKVEAARKDGKTLTIQDAMRETIAENQAREN